LRRAYFVCIQDAPFQVDVTEVLLTSTVGRQSIVARDVPGLSVNPSIITYEAQTILPCHWILFRLQRSGKKEDDPVARFTGAMAPCGVQDEACTELAESRGDYLGPLSGMVKVIDQRCDSLDIGIATLVARLVQCG